MDNGSTLSRIGVVLSFLVLVTFGAGCGSAQCPRPTASSWRVYRGDVLVLSGASTPGVLLSSAHPPPSGPPLPVHPFISADAHDPASEHELREILDASASAEDFLRRLCGAGFRVEEGEEEEED